METTSLGGLGIPGHAEIYGVGMKSLGISSEMDKKSYLQVHHLNYRGSKNWPYTQITQKGGTQYHKGETGGVH